MSLKSFDKFCETIITGESASRKIIYDERQKQIASKLNTEALMIFAIAAALNTIVMDMMYQWCDTFFAPMVLIAALCYIYWTIRCYFKGILFGINGVNSAKWTSIIIMIQMVCYFLTFISKLEEDGGAFHDGMISTRLISGVSFAIVFVNCLATFVFVKRAEKSEQYDNTDTSDGEKKG